mmetsp:Transcript_39939/g.90109  ORF Transcript_39939/g.90109 Transcript_39939/m.90109 type:complete len:194 (-) Transcript_39939:216-797(-)
MERAEAAEQALAELRMEHFTMMAAVRSGTSLRIGHAALPCAADVEQPLPAPRGARASPRCKRPPARRRSNSHGGSSCSPPSRSPPATARLEPDVPTPVVRREKSPPRQRACSWTSPRQLSRLEKADRGLSEAIAELHSVQQWAHSGSANAVARKAAAIYGSLGQRGPTSDGQRGKSFRRSWSEYSFCRQAGAD